LNRTLASITSFTPAAAGSLEVALFSENSLWP
jgi:hypothetical protein